MRLCLKLYLLLVLISSSVQGFGRERYGFNLPEPLIEQKYSAKQQQIDALNPYLSVTKVSDFRLKERIGQDDSFAFLIFLLLIGTVAIFKVVQPTFFKNIFRAFRNPNLAARQLKEQLRQDSPPSLVMDLIFCVSGGMYIFYLLQHVSHATLSTQLPQPLLLLAFILIFVVVYTVRFSFLRFTGWAFNIKEATDAYTVNLFLINKILGLLLIPFTLVLAFGHGAWVDICLTLSYIVIGFLMLNRFTRSGLTFGFFLKFSKFHFFMYLCASELLPLAVLIKLVNQWLID